MKGHCRLLLIFLLPLFSCTDTRQQKETNHFSQDFEQLEGWAKVKITNEISAHSGKFCNRIDEEVPYGATFTIANPKIKMIKVSAWCNFSNSDCKGSLCINITDKAEQSKQWENTILEEKVQKSKSWTKVYLYATLKPEAQSQDNKISIFAMNNGKSKFYIDDVEIEMAE